MHRRHFHCAVESFDWLRRPLELWTQRVQRYADHWSTRERQRCAAYWHGELATTSVLAAALAEAGLDVLCEYSCERTDPESAGRRGRTDLWCSGGSEHGSVLEAKQVWPGTVDDMKGDLLPRKFREAQKQLRSEVGLDPDTILLSTVFAVPAVHWNQEREDHGDDFLEYLADLTDGWSEAAAWAWCFPESAQRLRGLLDENLVYPGVVAVMRQVTAQQ